VNWSDDFGEKSPALLRPAWGLGASGPVRINNISVMSQPIPDAAARQPRCPHDGPGGPRGFREIFEARQAVAIADPTKTTEKTELGIDR
jgi:hypothetical protein